MLKYFKDLPESVKIELVERRKNDARKTRRCLLRRFSKAFVDKIWYCKDEYISNITYDPDYLFDVRENCSTPLTLTTVIYDKPANYGQRDVLYKCRCGKFYHGV